MPRTYLLDTNTFSYIAKGNSPAARAMFFKHSQDREAVLSISSISEAEVRYGMEKRALSRERRAAIEGLFAHLTILPWGSNEAAAYARAKAKLESEGIAVATMDMLIAAQAIAAKAVLVTRASIFARMDDLRGVENWASDL